MNEINSNKVKTKTNNDGVITSQSNSSILISKEDTPIVKTTSELLDDNQTRATSGLTSPSSNMNINKANAFILNQTVNVLNLKEILQLFNCAISQEQAWAVLYQTLNGLKCLFAYNLDLIKLNIDNITIDLLYFNKDGNILFGFRNRSEAANTIVLGNGFTFKKTSPKDSDFSTPIFFAWTKRKC